MKKSAIYLLTCVFSLVPLQASAACPVNKIIAVEDNAWNVEIDIKGQLWKAVGPGGALKTATVGVICLGNSILIQKSNASDGNECTYKLPYNSQEQSMSGSYGCTKIQPKPDALFVGQFQ